MNHTKFQDCFIHHVGFFIAIILRMNKVSFANIFQSSVIAYSFLPYIYVTHFTCFCKIDIFFMHIVVLLFILMGLALMHAGCTAGRMKA